MGVDKTNGVGGGLKIWVLEAGAKRDSTNTATQTVTVTLSPYEVAPDGSHVPVDVATAAWPTRRNLMPGAAFDRLVEVWAADDRDDGYCGRTYVTPVGLSAPAGSACGADQSVCVPTGLASA